MDRPTGESDAEDKFRHAIAEFIGEHRELRLRISELTENLLDAQRYRKLKRLYETANGYWFLHAERLSSEQFDDSVDALPIR
jgi:dephospho-CoA kinase